MKRHRKIYFTRKTYVHLRKTTITILLVVNTCQPKQDKFKFDYVLQ